MITIKNIFHGQFHHSEIITSLKINISNQDYLPSCTSSGLIIQLGKVSSVYFHLLRRSWAYKTYGQTIRVIHIYTPNSLFEEGIIKTNMFSCQLTSGANSVSSIPCCNLLIFSSHIVFTKTKLFKFCLTEESEAPTNSFH